MTEAGRWIARMREIREGDDDSFCGAMMDAEEAIVAAASGEIFSDIGGDTYFRFPDGSALMTDSASEVKYVEIDGEEFDDVKAEIAELELEAAIDSSERFFTDFS